MEIKTGFTDTKYSGMVLELNRSSVMTVMKRFVLGVMFPAMFFVFTAAVILTQHNNVPVSHASWSLAD